MRGIYIVGGYPDLETFYSCVNIIYELGFDFIEVGLPFSESVADGEIISNAIQNVVQKKISLNEIIDILKNFKSKKFKKYVMTYSNILYSYGLSKFSKNFKKYIDSVIIADLPNKMYDFFINKGFSMCVIPFVTPESRLEDIKKLKNRECDFIYFIGIRGITGGTIDINSNYIKEKINLIKELTGKKVIIGFGLKNRQHTKKALEIADGFVIGTEAVKRQKNIIELKTYLESILD